jgi:hypothetical protein
MAELARTLLRLPKAYRIAAAHAPNTNVDGGNAHFAYGGQLLDADEKP